METTASSASYMQFSDSLRVEKRGNVVMATINRPRVKNALNSELRSQLSRFWRWVRDEDSVRVAIVTGADRNFSSGRDLKETAEAYDSGASGTAAELAGDMGYPSDIATGKPIIAAIDGYCLAAGLKLAMGCTLRICTPDATFGNPQVKVGRGTEMPLRMIKLGISHALALDLAYTGDPIDAERALGAGFVSRMVAPEDLLNTAWTMAERIASNSPSVVHALTALLDRGVVDLPLDRALVEWNEEPGLFGATEDAIEGARAFRDGRGAAYSD